MKSIIWLSIQSFFYVCNKVSINNIVNIKQNNKKLNNNVNINNELKIDDDYYKVNESKRSILEEVIINI